MDVLYIAVICTLILACKCQEIAFFRCNNNTKTLQFIYATDQTQVVYDIHADTKSSTCGLRAGVFSGTGVVRDPYIMEIDLSSGLEGQNPDCGVKQNTDGTVDLVMIVQTSCEGVRATDSRFTSDCHLLIPETTEPLINDVASYSCIYPSTILFNFFQDTPGLDAPADIYASGKRKTCAKTAGSGSGQGVEGDPFVISVDVGNSATDCGVQRNDGEVYSVVMYVQQFESILTSSDVSYLLTCNFTTQSSIVIESQILPAVSSPPVRTPEPTVQTASLSVVSGSGSGDLTSIYVGEQIRLVAQLLDGPAVGLRITWCEAMPAKGLEPVIQLLKTDGCPTSPGLIPEFIGQSPTGTVALTNAFDAFKFDESDTVYFRCEATLCYEDDLSCLGSHCEVNRRRRRDATHARTETLGLTIHVREHQNQSDSSGVPASLSILTNDHSHNVTIPEDPKSCTYSLFPWPYTAIVVVSCTGALAIISLLFSLCLLSKLYRMRKKKDAAKSQQES